MRTFSPLTEGRTLSLGFYHSGGKKLRRYMARNGGRITAITNHGIVGDIDSLQRELLKTSRTLSVNYGVASDGKIYGCVAEQFKANTTSHASDHYSATLEIANSPVYPHKMTDAAFDSAARLNADICQEHGIIPGPGTINFHREYIATQCPGDHTWARAAEFIALVQKYYRGGTVPTPAPKPTPIEEKPTPVLEDIMTETRLYRRTTTGEVFVCNPSTGLIWHVPNTGILGYVKQMPNLLDSHEMIELTDDFFRVLTMLVTQGHNEANREAITDKAHDVKPAE